MPKSFLAVDLTVEDDMHRKDDPSRRHTLTGMRRGGPGVHWTGGVPPSSLLASDTQTTEPGATGGVTFVQINESHIGFARAPNADTAKMSALTRAHRAQASLVLHTGAISHLSRPEHVDAAEPVLRGAGLDTTEQLMRYFVRSDRATSKPVQDGERSRLTVATAAAVARCRGPKLQCAVLLMAALAVSGCTGFREDELRDTQTGAVAVCRSEPMALGLGPAASRATCARVLQAKGFKVVDKASRLRAQQEELQRYGGS